MILRTLQLLTWSFCLLACSGAVYAQGTTEFGFEEFAAGSLPPFVKQTYPPSFPGQQYSMIATFAPTQPYEGEKYLWAYGGILLQSPDGQPIQSYTLHCFVPGLPLNWNQGFGIAGKTDPPVIQFDVWQTIKGSFSSPAQGVDMFAIYSIGENFGYGFAIDAVEFTTVPE